MNLMERVYFQLLLLQLEEYDLSRFLKVVLKTKGRPPKSPIRKPLVWTQKIKLIYGVSLAILLVLLFGTNFLNVDQYLKLAILALLGVIHYYAHFIFITIATILLYPLDYLVKEVTIARAKKKIKGFKNLKVIGIAGSYGKTGMKEFVATVLSQRYKVLKTSGSVNTPFAIAELILKKLDDNIDIFVVEMGEYYRGDIKNLCSITTPDISIVTGINEAHLERLVNLENTVATIFEIVENSKPTSFVLLNGKDKNILDNYKKHSKGREVYLYKNKGRGEFDESIPGYILKVGKAKIYFPLLGEFNLDKVDGAINLAKKLGLTDNEIIAGIKNIVPVPHRLQPLANKESDTLIIDDSYNGNPDGVKEAIATLALFKKKKKIYVTPGLVEMGAKKHEIHYNIGKDLAGVADLVVLIKNSVTPDIEKGLLDNGFAKKNIVWFESANEAYGEVRNITKPGTVVLLQNDWPDNYL
jgi:UDP-N-acetylmuramoyl-tripeptide--D-alanyl-D-alanine ligase